MLQQDLFDSMARCPPCPAGGLDTGFWSKGLWEEELGELLLFCVGSLLFSLLFLIL